VLHEVEGLGHRFARQIRYELYCRSVLELGNQLGKNSCVNFFKEFRQFCRAPKKAFIQIGAKKAS